MKVGILGASGSVGSLIVHHAREAGHALRVQARTETKLKALGPGLETHAFSPTDASALATFTQGLDAVIFALGTDKMGQTTLFSDSTRALLPAMDATGTKRLIAITGVGAGDTRGHGGFLYDRLIFPLFTRARYADKDRQEALISASSLDWIIVRPAPFADRAPPGELQVVTEVASDTKLTRITRDEVARFVAAQLTSDTYLRERPFIGHP